MTPHRSRQNMLALAACVAGLAIAPAAASAADTTTTVTGTVSSELSVGVSTAPTPMVLSRSRAGTSAAVISVVSTTPWTLTVHDAGATTPGRMDKVDCITRQATTGSLAEPVQWTAGDLNGTLSGTPATLATGSLLADLIVNFKQPVGAAEEINANDCYELTTTFTVS